MQLRNHKHTQAKLSKILIHAAVVMQVNTRYVRFGSWRNIIQSLMTELNIVRKCKKKLQTMKLFPDLFQITDSWEYNNLIFCPIKSSPFSSSHLHPRSYIPQLLVLLQLFQSAEKHLLQTVRNTLHVHCESLEPFTRRPQEKDPGERLLLRACPVLFVWVG